MRRALVLALLASLSLPRNATAYEQRIHMELSRRAYAGPPEPTEDPAAVVALRARIYRAGAEASDPALRARFRARWPTPESFDSWEMKHLFALDPGARVVGFDDLPLPPGSGVESYAVASRLPDDDHRNQDRYRRDARREIVRDAWGRPLPEDPATLAMGSLTGLSSQAHAHYGLARVELSDDPAVLKTDPRRFAIPTTARGFTAEFAGSYTVLAILAARLPGGERLALAHAGAAAHHLEDAANQIHTVQVGLYDFFVDAKIQSILEDLRTAGGLLGPREGMVPIGIQILTNHHLIAEGLYAKKFLAGDSAAQPTGPPDPELAKALARIPPGCGPEVGEEIVQAIVERSSLEGAEVYRAIREVADRRWSRAGVRFEDGDDPEAALRPGANLDRFLALEVAGMVRARQGLSTWWERFLSCRGASPEVEAAIAERLVKVRLYALDAAEARAAAWKPAPPESRTVSWWVPATYLALLAIAVSVARVVLRRRARGR